MMGQGFGDAVAAKEDALLACGCGFVFALGFIFGAVGIGFLIWSYI